MKNKILILVLGMLSTIGVISAQGPVGAGTRVDYVNAAGTRIYSQQTYSYYSAVQLFKAQQLSDRWIVSGTPTEPFASVEFTPWGTQEYPVEITSDEEDVEVSYQVIENALDGSESTCKVPMKAGLSELLCGTLVRVYVKVPEGSFPTVSIVNEYTQPDYPNEFNAFISLYPPTFYKGVDLLDVEYRQYYLKQHENTSIFVKDGSIPNLWYFNYEIPNEPSTVKISYQYPNGDLLRTEAEIALLSLYSQEQSYNYNVPFCNGDPFFMRLMGDFISQDFITGAMAITPSIQSLLNYNESFAQGTSAISVLPWTLCYKFISLANLVLSRIDKFSFATQDERDIARAQMLTLRSHGYWRLLQIFAPRWSDSNSGNTLCAPLETTFNTEYQAPASMKEIVDKCYSDLNEAIQIFSRTNYTRKKLFEPNEKVARGVLMRLAMLREDWPTAKEQSAQIMQGVNLTSNQELTSGFFNPTDSWLWGASNNETYGPNQEFQNSLYFWSDQHFMACNGAYPAMWKMGSNAIDKSLYLKMNSDDVRRELYVMQPTLSSWYRSTTMNPTTLFLINSSAIRNVYASKKPDGVNEPAFTYEGSEVPVAFGAQVKFYLPSLFDGSVCFMRAEEILLSHAEASINLGDKASAIADLNRLNKMRSESYAELTVNSDLTNELRTARKLELWGEGQSWFDQKRWKMPITRQSWIEGDTQSGNWPASMAINCAVEDGNGWRVVIPTSYVNKNPNINLQTLGYKNLPNLNSSSTPLKNVKAEQPKHPMIIKEIEKTPVFSVLP